MNQSVYIIRITDLTADEAGQIIDINVGNNRKTDHLNIMMAVLKWWLRAMAITVGDQFYEWALDDSFYLFSGNRNN